MALGDAAKVHTHAGQLVEDARARGELEIVILVRDIRDALGLDYEDAAIDICKVLETHKFRRANGLFFDDKTGPNQGLSTEYTFRIL